MKKIIVSYNHFSLFVKSWQVSGAGLAADFDGNNVVDWNDMDIFVRNWLYEYHTTPREGN